MLKRTAQGHHRDEAPDRRRAKGAVTIGAALVIGLVASGATYSAFSATRSNTGNSFQSGTVSLTDNSSGSTMFTLTGMRPGNPVSKCIQVTYTGSLPSGVSLYGATTSAAGGLEGYVNLTVTRGTVSSGSFGDCTNFTADAANHKGLGAGVLYSGLMSAYPSTQAAGITDPTASWSTNDSHYYKFTVDVADDNAAEGKSATETFTWDAR